jgi:hypothetical protein
MQDRPFGNFYIRCKVDGSRTFRNLKTSDPAEAEAELARVRAEQTGRPWANGNIRWHREDWEQFSNLRGQTRVAKQGYALAARAIQALSTQESRFAYLLVIPQTTILAELGRISDPTIMFLAADEICDRELRSKPAIAFLPQLARQTLRREALDTGGWDSQGDRQLLHEAPGDAVAGDCLPTASNGV